MKLPLFRSLFVLFDRRPNPPPLPLLLERPAAPPAQNKTVAMNRAATAAHMKPKLYLPRFAVMLLFLKSLRPMTYAAVISAATRVWKKRATEANAPDRKLPILLHKARMPVMRDTTAKKSAMRTKANMNRVR